MEDEKTIITAADEPTAVQPSTAATEETAAAEKKEQAVPTKPETEDKPSAEDDSDVKADENDNTAADEPQKSDNSAEKIAALEGKVHALSVGIAVDSLDDVIALAKSKVGGEITLEIAIDSVIEKYPQFKAANGSAKQIVTTGVPASNDDNDSVDDAKINRIMGIK